MSRYMDFYGPSFWGFSLKSTYQIQVRLKSDKEKQTLNMKIYVHYDDISSSQDTFKSTADSLNTKQRHVDHLYVPDY